ncbi:MAG: hypothetical protein RLZZ557_344, partial [Bacteroidota bacterium]
MRDGVLFMRRVKFSQRKKLGLEVLLMLLMILSIRLQAWGMDVPSNNRIENTFVNPYFLQSTVSWG